jgi:hypothetical protein
LPSGGGAPPSEFETAGAKVEDLRSNFVSTGYTLADLRPELAAVAAEFEVQRAENGDSRSEAEVARMSFGFWIKETPGGKTERVGRRASVEDETKEFD